MPTITELKTQHDEMIDNVEALIGKAASETGLDDDDRVTLKEFVDESKLLKARIEQAKSDDAALTEIKSMFAGVLPPGGEPAGGADRAKSLGEQFIESDGYKNRGASPKSIAPVSADGLFKSLVRAGSLAAGGYVLDALATERLGVIDQSIFPLRVFRNLVDVQSSDSAAIEWLVRTFTNNAAEVAEATATSGSSGTKPESAHTWATKSTVSTTIAHWEPVTKKMLNNAAQVKGIIEGDLLGGLEDRLDDEIINGDGSAPNIAGILATSGIQTQAFATDVFTTLIKAKTKVRLNARRMVTAAVLNPADIEAILLTRDGSGGAGTGSYLYGGPAQMASGLTVWGMPIVESENVTAGTAIVADWKQAKLYDVVRASVTWTDSHSDWFIRNIAAVLAEMDVMFAVFQPQAFVSTDISA